MATINFVVPPLHACQFTGGIYCISRYAIGLRRRGHQVNLIPLLPSPYPEWIGGDFGWMPDGSKRARWRATAKELTALIRSRIGKRPRIKSRVIKQQLLSTLLLTNSRLLPPVVNRAVQISYVADHIPDADVTIATSFDTALAVHLKGRGRLYYFAQHYEPYFAAEMPDPLLAEQEAAFSYRLGLNIIANSSWLQSKLSHDVGINNVALCPNAIDHTVFTGEVKPAALDNEVRIISYGGRNAVWKGFAEMAEAVRLARAQLPERQLRWQVYGSSLLPPDNSIAPYEPLGFLQPPALAAAYRAADLLLSASWYESFPLFPIEAMACGLPVITTQPGTEEYATNNLTAAVVEPRNPSNIAAAIVRLITDVIYRKQIAHNGQQIAQQFTWETSVTKMEQLLLQQEALVKSK